MRSLFIFLLCHCILNTYAQPKCSHKSALSYKNTSTASTVYLNLVDQYDLTSVEFNLNLSALNKDISGYVVLHIIALEDMDTLAFELHPNFTIDSIFIGAVSITDISRSGDQCYVNPFFPLTTSNSYAVRIYYHGTAPNGNSWGSGFVNTNALGYNTTYSLSVPYYTHHWWPCKQVLPDLIDSVSMTITTDTAYTVSSNGLRTQDVDLGNGQHRVSWQTHYPINYYLISVNVGTHIEYNQSVLIPGTSTPTLIQNFVFDQNSITSKKAILDTLDDFLMYYSNLFGIYPFHQEKFGICMVNLEGGMEHQTLVNLSHIFDYYLAAHEMSHQWWGDGINVDNLNDMWLNEGFASYCEFLTAQHFFPSQAAAIMSGYHNTAKSYSMDRVYVDDLSDFSTIYNSLVYEKGAGILHTLRYLVNNDSVFFNAMKSYHYARQYSTTNASIFKTHMENETGLNLDQFFDEWYYGYGYPKYSLRWSVQQDSLLLKLSHTTTNAITPVYHVPVEIKIKRTGGNDTIVKMNYGDSIVWWKAHVDSINYITGFEIDPHNFIINGVTSILMDSNLVNVHQINNYKTSLKLFPNPVVHELSFHYEGNISLISVYDMQGRLIMSCKPSKYKIDVSSFQNGMYIFEIKGDKGIEIYPFMKQNP